MSAGIITNLDPLPPVQVYQLGENIGASGTDPNLLKERRRAAAEEQGRTRFLLVDEFQEPKLAQVEFCLCSRFCCRRILRSRSRPGHLPVSRGVQRSPLLCSRIIFLGPGSWHSKRTGGRFRDPSMCLWIVNDIRQCFAEGSGISYQRAPSRRT